MIFLIWLCFAVILLITVMIGVSRLGCIKRDTKDIKFLLSEIAKNGYGLEMIEEEVLVPILPIGGKEKLIRLLRQGEEIEAKRYFVKSTGFSMKATKDYIDKLKKELNIDYY